MASRPRWKGMLSLGLVNVPVVLFATTDAKSKAPTGHGVHRNCQRQLKHKKWCETCNYEVTDEELMRGYDVPGGGFVELTDDELSSLKVESTKTIVITRTAHESELEPLMVESTNYLVSDGTPAATEAEAVLVEALRGHVAVGTLVLSGKERPVALMVYDSGFVLHVLRTADQMKSLPQRVPLPVANPQMVELAKGLVAAMAGPIELDQTVDGYAEGMRQLIAAKASGEEIVVAPAAPAAKVVSLMDALKASMAATTAPPVTKTVTAKADLKPAKKARKSA